MDGSVGRHRSRPYGRELNALANPDEPCVNTTDRLEHRWLSRPVNDFR
jgi:hypothetical protein